jgi:hypothetical protein
MRTIRKSLHLLVYVSVYTHIYTYMSTHLYIHTTYIHPYIHTKTVSQGWVLKKILKCCRRNLMATTRYTYTLCVYIHIYAQIHYTYMYVWTYLYLKQTQAHTHRHRRTHTHTHTDRVARTGTPADFRQLQTNQDYQMLLSMVTDMLKQKEILFTPRSDMYMYMCYMWM